MFDIISYLDSLFGAKVSSVREIMYEFTCSYNIGKGHLPSSTAIMEMISQIPQQDNMTIAFSADEDSAFITKKGTLWIDAYEQFAEVISANQVIVDVKIEKSILNGSLNIYNINAFQDFFQNTTIQAHLMNFTKLFDICGENISFRLLGTHGLLMTNSIVLSDGEVERSNAEFCRSELIKNCDDASVFLNRTQIRVIPQDFSIRTLGEDGKFQGIVQIFENLKNILAFIYLANTSSIHEDRVVLSFNPVDGGYEYLLSDLSVNSVVADIYSWVFKDAGCVDKASIARKIINIYCKTQNEILLIDRKIYNSIKSDYQIYQRNHVEQYIDMKNKISDHIVECAKQIQELTHELSEAMRNNLVAILVFLMTAFLTESIDLSKLLEKDISPRIAIVCGAFTVASLVYLIVTNVITKQKWQWLTQSYQDLKENYRRTLDENDIEEAFNHDASFSHSKEQYESFKKKVMWLWGVVVITMVVMSVVLISNGVAIKDTNEVSQTAYSETSTVTDLEQKEENDNTIDPTAPPIENREQQLTDMTENDAEELGGSATVISQGSESSKQ